MANYCKMKAFIVLGMFRSGTSLIAQGLSKVVNMDITEGLPTVDKYEYCENIDFVMLNTKIINAAGGSWDNPPMEDSILAQRKIFEKEIKILVDKHKTTLWGWKDPLTTLTIKLYLPYIENPHFICCIRTPLEVAKSLNKKMNISMEKSIELTKIYNKRMLDFITEYAGVI